MQQSGEQAGLSEDNLSLSRLSSDSNLLLSAVHGGTVISGGNGLGTTVDLEQLAKVDLGGREHLDVADEDVLQGVDALGGLLNLFANNVRHQFLDQLVKVNVGGLAGDDIDHLLADAAGLGALGVRGLAGLVLAALGEANGEHAERVAIGGLDVREGLNQGVPLADKRAKLVGSDVHPVEVGQELAASNVGNFEFELVEGIILALVLEVPEGDLEHAAQERVTSELYRK
jgi:hypothetical protein